MKQWREQMKYTLRQLEVFLAVAQTGNITRAVDKLSMSQSAASGAIKELEERFNMQLFDRVGKRLQINSAGLELQPKAEELLVRAQELEGSVKGTAEFGNLRVGATMTVGNYLLIDLLSGFSKQYPEAHVSLGVSNTANIVERVINFECDIGLIEGEVNRKEIDVIPWRDDELAVVCSPQHPLAAKNIEGISREELLSINWVMREKGSGTRQTFERAMYGVLQDLNYVLELEQIEAIKRAVMLDMGVACLSRLSVSEELDQGKLVELKIPNRNFKRYFYVILHKDKYISPGVEKWLDYCGVVIEEIFFFR